MKAIINILRNRHFWPLFIVIVFAVLAGRSLIFQSGYFNMHDDLQMMRQLEMEKCFLDGQIPCRWVPDMGYGFGFPLFNFYPPLPYLMGQGIRLIGYSFVTTAKLMFALSFIVSGITMYLLAKDFFGRLGGVLSGVFYIWAPYYAVDVYVRGAMNEAWALAWFPLIFWAGYRLVISKKREGIRWIILLALAYFALFTSHNLMVLIFTPFFGMWILLHLWRENKWSRIPQLLISMVWALGLAAFFTLPALAENRFTYIRNQLEGYFDYTAHFVSLRQLLTSRFWGYGGSAWGIVNDKMSFQIGYLHWILSLIIALFLAIRVGGHLVRPLARRGSLWLGEVIGDLKKDKLLLVTAFLLAVGWFSAFMTHLRSIQIYQTIPYLRFIQFPWRFLAIVIFSFSFIVGAIPGVFAEWKVRHKFLAKLFATVPQLFISFLLVFLILILNWRYFRPEGRKMGPLTDKQKFSGAAWELQQGGGVIDYLPKAAKVPPESSRQTLVEIMDGKGTILDSEQGTYWAKFRINLESEEAVVRINIFDFPGWRIFLDNREIEKFVPDEEMLGRMWISLPAGEHLVYAQLFNTPVRTASNLISLVSWAGMISYPLWRKRFS